MLSKYGNNLGSVNLLIQLQGIDGGRLLKMGDSIITNVEIDFREVYKKINKIKLKFKGEILIMYNELNKFTVLYQVYPELKIMKKPIDDNFLAGEILYN